MEALCGELHGDHVELRWLWENAADDDCGLAQKVGDDSLEPCRLDQPGWVAELRRVTESWDDAVISGLADLIIVLGAQIDNMQTDEASSALRRARAMAWLEIARRIDGEGPAADLSVRACREVGRRELMACCDSAVTVPSA